MKKKRLIIILCSLAVIAVIIGVVIYINDKDTCGYHTRAQLLYKEFNADIMLYGEELYLDECVRYRRIDEITEETLKPDEDHGYRAIILFDHDGTMDISDEELLLIKRYVEEKGYDMYYIGKSYLDDFKRLGFTAGYEEDEYSLEYIGSIHYGKEVDITEAGNLYAEHGLWCDEYEEWLEDNEEEIQDWLFIIMYDNARRAAGIKF